MRYVDGYVLPLPKKNVKAYRRMAQAAGKIWREHGALEFRECVGDDLDVKWAVAFTRTLKVKRGETVVFSWITFKSRAHRNAVKRQGAEGPAPRKDEDDALRRQAHGVRRLQGPGRRLVSAPPRRDYYVW
jgi:uncharacterized protein YbaA (DUF1428 family)